jgi:probable addiction module antidote protein
MANVKLRKWDVVNYLENDERIVGYLEAVLEDGLPELIAAALVDIARAKGLLDTSAEIHRGQSLLEKAIEDSYKRPSKEVLTVIQNSKIPLTKWDAIDHWETDEDIIAYMQLVLEDQLPEHVAITLVDIARAKGLLDPSGESPLGESLFGKAIDESYRRHLNPSNIVPTKMQVS